MTLWCKRINCYPPRCICITHIWSDTLFPRGIIIFQGVLTKFHFLMKFPHLEKIVHLMKTYNMNTKVLFPCGGRVKLNFRDRYRKLNIYSKNSSCYQVLHQIPKNCNFGVKKNHYPSRCICMTHI